MDGEVWASMTGACGVWLVDVRRGFLIAGSSVFGVAFGFFECLSCSTRARHFGASLMRLKGDGLSDIIDVVCALTDNANQRRVSAMVFKIWWV